MKALIVNSGTPVKRYSSNLWNGNTEVDTRYLGPPPDEFQGYGMMTLSNILPLKDGTGLIPDLMLYVYDQLRVLNTNMTYQFIVSIDNATAVKGLPIKLSIVWNDVPYNGALGAKTLVNDFDCAIITPSNAVYMGNKNPKGDNVNTVEQIYLIAGETGDYSIYVTAKVLIVSSMNVSIALTYPTSSKSVSGPIVSTTFPISNSSNFITSSPNSVPVSPPDVIETLECNCSAYYIVFDETLSPEKDTAQIGSFNATGKLRYIDFQITNGLSFNSQQLAAVLITAPNGLRAQVGGSWGWIAYDDNIYVRYWGPSSTGFGRGKKYYNFKLLYGIWYIVYKCDRNLL